VWIGCELVDVELKVSFFAHWRRIGFTTDVFMGFSREKGREEGAGFGFEDAQADELNEVNDGHEEWEWDNGAGEEDGAGKLLELGALGTVQVQAFRPVAVNGDGVVEWGGGEGLIWSGW
jgi:hypothetical protein